MTPRVRSGRLPVSIMIGFCAASCGRIGFDLIPQDAQQAITSDAGGGAGSTGTDATAGAPSSGGSSGSSGAGGAANGGASSGGLSASGASGGTTGVGGSGGAGGVSGSSGAGGLASGGATATGGASSGDASSGGTSGTGGAASGGASTGGAASGGTPGTGGNGSDAGPPLVCGNTTATIKVWSFDSTVESWQFWPNGSAGALSWAPLAGNPAPGALALDVTSGTGTVGWIVMDAAAPNLAGHTASAWIKLDNSANGSVGVKMYAQSDPTKFAWADGGFVVLTPKTWTCLTLNFDAPVYKDATFDPTKVVRFGIEIGGAAPLTFYVDQVAY